MSERFQFVDIYELDALAREQAQEEFEGNDDIEAIVLPEIAYTNERSRAEVKEDILETLDVLDVLLDKKGGQRSVYVNSFEVTDNQFATTYCSLKTGEHRDIRTSRIHLRDQQLFIWKDSSSMNVLLYLTECDKETDELQQVVAHYGSFYQSARGIMVAHRVEVRDGAYEELDWEDVHDGTYGPKVDEYDRDRVDLAAPIDSDDVSSVGDMINQPYQLLNDMDDTHKLKQINNYLFHAQSLMDSSSVSPE